jgi:hypothetical protein
MDHHLGPGEAALGAAWMEHHLCGGPAIPAEPVLREDLSIEADESAEVVARELWWTPSACADDLRCWLRDEPADRRAMTQAFGRVRYASGLTLNTRLRSFEPAGGAPALPAAWPRMTDGVGYHWGLLSTQFHRTEVAIEAVEGDPTRARWTVDRPGGGPVSVLFRGLADPRWNDGGIGPVAIELDWLGGKAEKLEAVAEFETSDNGRASDTIPVSPRAADGRDVVEVRLEDFPKRPAGATWRDLKRLVVQGAITGNRFVVGPVRKTV